MIRPFQFATPLVLGAVLFASPMTVQAQNPSCTSPSIVNLVQNCSFEDGATRSGGWQFTNDITSWTSNSKHFERWYGHDSFTSRDGTAHLELDVDFDANGSGKVANTTIWQVITTEKDRVYDVFFSIAHRRKNNDRAFSQIGLMLDLGGNPIALEMTPFRQTNQYFNDQSYQTLSTGDWKDYAFQFTATGSSTTIGFRAMGTENEYGDHLDNIGVVGRPRPGVVGVPEPASLALVGAGLSALAVTARRRRRA